jgi:hypothetical protein
MLNLILAFVLTRLLTTVGILQVVRDIQDILYALNVQKLNDGVHLLAPGLNSSLMMTH